MVRNIEIFFQWLESKLYMTNCNKPFRRTVTYIISLSICQMLPIIKTPDFEFVTRKTWLRDVKKPGFQYWKVSGLPGFRFQ